MTSQTRGFVRPSGRISSSRSRLYTEYLDLGRSFRPGHAAVVADYLRRKYSGIKIDAVIAVYPGAVEFLLANKRAPFHGVPIIACAITPSLAESLEHSPARRLITGQIVGENAIGVLDDALRLRPGTKRVALVAGTTPNDEYTARLFREALKRYTDRLDLIDLTGAADAGDSGAGGISPPGRHRALRDFVQRWGGSELCAP